MSKKLFISLVVSIVIISQVLTGCSPSTAINTGKLKYADQNRAEEWEGSHAAQPWLDQITKATNNRVQFETYFAESLFNRDP